MRTIEPMFITEQRPTCGATPAFTASTLLSHRVG